MAEIEQNTLPAIQPVREQLPALLEKNLPLLEKRKANALAALDEITQITNDEEAEDAVAYLAAVREVYKANNEMRKVMTDMTDAFKDALMEYERDFNPDAKAKNKYNEKKKILEDYNQAKLDRVRAQQAEASKKKEVENFKVDLRSRILEALSNNVVETVKVADNYARTLFASLTLENFDKEAEKFKRAKPKLKIETYEKCFEVPNDLMPKAKQLLSPGEFSTFVNEFKLEQTYDIWNTSVQESVAPVMNEWRARIPELKEELVVKSKASEEEKIRLADERKKRDEQEQADRKVALDKAQEQQKAQIQSDAEVNKMSNNFAAQAAVQSMDDAGGVKLVLKFTEPALTPKALMAIIYHCFSHADFPGIQKRDAKKKLVVDGKGRQEYIEAIQWWIDFYLKNCDAAVEGTQIFEDAKTIVRR